MDRSGTDSRRTWFGHELLPWRSIVTTWLSGYLLIMADVSIRWSTEAFWSSSHLVSAAVEEQLTECCISNASSACGAWPELGEGNGLGDWFLNLRGSKVALNLDFVPPVEVGSAKGVQKVSTFCRSRRTSSLWGSNLRAIRRSCQAFSTLPIPRKEQALRKRALTL